MAKKKQTKVSKMLKAQQLQQISIAPVGAAAPSLASMAPAASAVSAPIFTTSSADRHLGREIWRTVISLLVVAALLVAAVMVDRRTGYFTTFGAWLFKALRLANK